MNRNELRTYLHDNAKNIADLMVNDWRTIALTEVWLALPQEMSFDDLPNLVRAIGLASLDVVFQRDPVAEVIRYAAIHGHHRSLEGFQEGFLYTEYHLLRRTLWSQTRQRLERLDAVDVITRADALISLSTMAGLRGFHQSTFVARGDWPAAIDRLIDEWPLIGH